MIEYEKSGDFLFPSSNFEGFAASGYLERKA